MGVVFLASSATAIARYVTPLLVFGVTVAAVVYVKLGRPSITIRARLTLETVDSMAHVVDRIEDAIWELDVVTLERPSTTAWTVITAPSRFGACEVVRIRARPRDQGRVRIEMSSRRRWFAGIYDDGKNERNLELLRIALCDDHRQLRGLVVSDPVARAPRRPVTRIVEGVSRWPWWVLVAWLVAMPVFAVRDVVRVYDPTSALAWFRIASSVAFQVLAAAIVVAAMTVKKRQRATRSHAPSEP